MNYEPQKELCSSCKHKENKQLCESLPFYAYGCYAIIPEKELVIVKCAYYQREEIMS